MTCVGRRHLNQGTIGHHGFERSADELMVLDSEGFIVALAFAIWEPVLQDVTILKRFQVQALDDLKHFGFLLGLGQPNKSAFWK